MTENKRYSFNWERGHPNFWDNYCDLADCYLTCEDVCELLNELNEGVVKGDLFKLTVAMAIQHRINWLKKQIWDNTDRIDELQSLKKELKL